MKKMVYGLAAVLALASAGCTGSFQLMQAVYHWHSDFEWRWTDEICYLVACILPIYSSAYVVDTVFLNSVEFWTDRQLISVETAEAYITRVDAETAIVKSKATGESYTLRRSADGIFTMTDAQGRSVSAEIQGSLLTMTTSDGEVRTTVL